MKNWISSKRLKVQSNQIPLFAAVVLRLPEPPGLPPPQAVVRAADQPSLALVVSVTVSPTLGLRVNMLPGRLLTSSQGCSLVQHLSLPLQVMFRLLMAP